VSGGAATICPSDNRQYTIAAITGAIDYTWQTPTAGVIIQPDRADANNTFTGTERTITVNFTKSFTATSATLNITANNSCGSSAERKVTIKKSTTCSTTTESTAKNKDGDGQSGNSLGINDEGSSTNVIPPAPETKTVESQSQVVPEQHAQQATEITPVATQQDLNLQAYPDYEKKKIVFTFNSDVADEYVYHIYDSTGFELTKDVITAKKGVNMKSIDASELPKSVYTLSVERPGTESHIDLTIE